MKRLLLTVTLLLTLFSTRADDISKMKREVTSQLLSSNQHSKVIEDLIATYYPNGTDSDLCIFELLAHPLPADREIEALLNGISDDGSWSNINYACTLRSAWDPINHIDNIMKLARAYKAEESKYYNDPKVLDAALKSITYWCDGGFKCRNWWYNDIGIPKVLAPAVLILENEISPELMARCVKVLDAADRREMTGQNKVWMSGVTFIKGLILEDKEILARTSSKIREELELREEEGIQYDYSFQQHGALQQFGNYGLAFASSQSYWMRIFNGTAYDYTPEQKEILRNYFIKGINTTIWSGKMDISSCGRQLFINSQAGKAASLLLSNLNMIQVDEQSRKEYEAYIIRNYITPQKNDLQGNFAFPMSKYTLHRGKDYMVSVKMFSKNVMGGEVTNNENLKGYHLADGATMIYRTGCEYENIPPIWDGKYMPGTTVVKNDEPLKALKHASEYVNGSNFAGCIGEGEYGMAALEYIRDGVHANKSWFFIGNQVVCLGNSISSKSGEALVTTLNQCNYSDAAYAVHGRKTKEIEANKTYASDMVYSDGIGYRSLDGATIEFGVKRQHGNWHDVAVFLKKDVVSGDVFTAQIAHKADEVGSYAYVIEPSISKRDFFKARNGNDFIVTQNDNNATIVEATDGTVTMVVFWQPATVETANFNSVTASSPIMTIIERDGNDVKFRSYDPLAAGGTVEL